MLTFRQIAAHLINSHNINEMAVLKMAVANDGDLDAAHTEEHSGGSSHSHNPDGTIVSETKTVLTDKSITSTSDGWSLDGTAAEVLQEFNSAMNSRKIRIRINNDQRTDGKLTGSLQAPTLSVEIEGSTFIDVIRLLLGEAYNAIEERNNQ